MGPSDLGIVGGALALGYLWQFAQQKRDERIAKQEACYHDWEERKMKSMYGATPYKQCRLCNKQDHTTPR